LATFKQHRINCEMLATDASPLSTVQVRDFMRTGIGRTTLVVNCSDEAGLRGSGPLRVVGFPRIAWNAGELWTVPDLVDIVEHCRSS